MKIGIFTTLVILFNIVLIEILSYGLTWRFSNFFEEKENYIEKEIRLDDYREFLRLYYDRVTGWDNSRGTRTPARNCEGGEMKYAFDQNGARIGTNPQGPKKEPEIIAVGDSFTMGAEVDGEDAYPNRLQELLGVGVVNHGVGGYGPWQATLQFEQKVKLYPRIKMAILGINYENIKRIPNTYRPATRRGSGMPFAFKPFVRVIDGNVVAVKNPNSLPTESLEELRSMVIAALATDYWRKPKAEFPFSVSVLRTLFTANVPMLVKEKLYAFLRKPKYADYYTDGDLLKSLHFVIERFVASARDMGIRPIIAFIPRNRQDLTSPKDFLARLREEFTTLDIVDVGKAEIEWNKYNFAVYKCHPSIYGYNAIADYIARFIRQRVGRL